MPRTSPRRRSCGSGASVPPVTTPAGPVAVTASFGLASLLADAPESCEKCLALVEQRLSQARSDGGNRIGITLLSDVMPVAEEVVLAAVPEQPAADDVGGEVVLDLSDDSSQLSVSELEALVRDETARRAVRQRQAEEGPFSFTRR